MFKNYLKVTLRNINRHKIFTAINVLGLSLGICACMIIFLITRYELSFDTFHPDKERIYRVTSKIKELDWSDPDVLPATPAAIRKEITGIENVAGYFPYYDPVVTIPGAGTAARKIGGNLNSVIIADPDYFAIFPHQWLAGSPASSLSQPFKVVLSEKAASKYFGSASPASIIGREIIYQDSLRLTVSGIVQDWQGNTDFPFTDFISFSTIPNSFLKNTRHLEDWQLIKGMGQNYWPVTFIKTSPGAIASRVDAQIKKMLVAHIGPAVSKLFTLKLQPLSDIHFNSNYADGDIRKADLPTLYALMAIASFILIIAAINFINLATAQSIQRAKEIGVRKVLGSSRSSLVYQFLTETFVICVGASLLAVLLAAPVLSLFRDFIPPGVKFNVLEPVTFLFIIGITLVTSLLAGFYPARMASGYLAVSSLKGTGEQKGGEKWWLRKGLIVFQFCISLVFIIGTLIIGKQIRFMLHSDFGLKTDAIVSLDNWSWQDDISKTKVMVERLSHVPGINKVMAQSGAPMGWGRNTNGIKYKGKNQISIDVDCSYGNDQLIPFYEMKLLAGRNLMHTDSLTEIVINETCARALGFSKPDLVLGKFIYLNDKPIPVVGVVGDFHQGSFHEVIRPMIIGHQPMSERSIAIKLATTGKDAASIKTVLAAIEKQWKYVYPEKEFSYGFMDENIASFYKKEERTLKLMQTAMSVAIFISCMGLFGLVMFTAQKRAKEIGIRKVLGASVANIAVMLSRDYMALVILALLIASPVAWLLMHAWLQDFVYRTTISWWIFSLSGLAAMIIALLTVGYQAVKAAVVNSVKSLRSE